MKRVVVNSEKLLSVGYDECFGEESVAKYSRPASIRLLSSMLSKTYL